MAAEALAGAECGGMTPGELEIRLKNRNGNPGVHQGCRFALSELFKSARPWRGAFVGSIRGDADHWFVTRRISTSAFVFATHVPRLHKPSRRPHLPQLK